MAVVATAEVQILADTSRFGPDLQRKLRQVFQRLNLDGDDIISVEDGEEVGENLAEGIQKGLSSNRNVIIEEGRRSARRMTVEMTETIRRNLRARFTTTVFDSVLEQARRSGINSGRIFSNAFQESAITDMIDEVEQRLSLLPQRMRVDEFRRRLTQIAREVAREQRSAFSEVIRDIGTRGREALDIDLDVDDVRNQIRVALQRAIPESELGNQLTERIKRDIQRGLDRSVFDTFQRESRRSGIEAGRLFGQEFSQNASAVMFDEVQRRIRELPQTLSRNEFRDRIRAIVRDVATGQQDLYRSITNDLRRRGPIALQIDADMSPLEQTLRRALASTIPEQGRISGRQFATGLVRGMVTALGGLLRGFTSVLGGIVTSVLEGEFNTERIFGGFRRGFESFRNGIGQITNQIRGFVQGNANIAESLDDVSRSSRNAGRGLKQLGSSAGGLSRFSGVGGAILTAVGAIVQFMLSVGSFATLLHVVQSAIGAVIYVVQVLAGTFLTLGSAVQQVLVGGLLLLPGVMTAIVGSFVLLNRAFEDFGPAADAVDRLKTGFDDLLTSAASRVWDGLTDNIDHLTNRLLPGLESGFNAAADGLNSFIGEVIDALSSDRVIQAVSLIGATVGRMFESLGPAAARATSALATLASAAAPVMVQLADAAGELVTRFSDWVEAAKNSGELRQIFSDMYTTLSLIVAIIGNIVQGFSNLFGFAVEGSQTFLDNVRQATEQFATWSSSSEAGQFVDFLVARASEFFQFIYDSFLAFKEWASSEAGQNLMAELVGFAERLFFFIVDMVKEFVAWAQSTEGIEMMRAIEQAALSFLGFLREVIPVFATIFSGALAVYNYIARWVSAAYDFVSVMPDITDIFSGLQNQASALLNTIREIFGTLTAIGRGGPTLGPGQTRTPTPNAYGSIVRRPTFIQAGERYLPEVIMPLSNEDRVEQLARLSGVDKILERRGVIGNNEPSVTMHVTSNSVNPTIVANKAIDMITRAWSGR